MNNKEFINTVHKYNWVKAKRVELFITATGISCK